jgi:hypothetical protein
MTTHYVLVDFENVQPESLSALVGGAYRVLVFIGAAQAKGRISFELSHSIQMLGANADYVPIARKQLQSMSGKPANRRKLAQAITAYLRHHGGAPDPRVVEQYIDELIRRKVVTVAGTKLNYTLG